jgi:hypothetical protein
MDCRLRILSFAAIMGGLLALGCAAKPVEMDVVTYVNRDILGQSVVESAALRRYAAVTGTNYTTDDKLYDVLNNEVVPTYREFVRIVEQVEPKTDEVKKLHAMYISASIYRLRGFETIMGGIQLQDPSLIEAANQMFAQSQAETDRWRQTLEQLYLMYGIVPQEQ